MTRDNSVQKVMRDLYGRLNIRPDASSAEIVAAYRKLAHKHHPDVGGDAERFKKIHEAYEILSDSEQRAAYDKELREDEQNYLAKSAKRTAAKTRAECRRQYEADVQAGWWAAKLKEKYPDIYSEREMSWSEESIWNDSDEDDWALRDRFPEFYRADPNLAAAEERKLKVQKTREGRREVWGTILGLVIAVAIIALAGDFGIVMAVAFLAFYFGSAITDSVVKRLLLAIIAGIVVILFVM